MENEQNYKTKQELSVEIWQRIRKSLDAAHITQAELQRMCDGAGYRISQPEISRLYSGKTSLTLYQCLAFSAVLGVPIDHFTQEKEPSPVFITDGKAFIVNPSDEAFNGYLGTYYTVFHSTSSFEDKYIYGKLAFSSSSSGEICEAVLELDTGEQNSRKQKDVKRYYGQLVLSDRMGVAYCMLANKEFGEISMIEIRHRRFMVGEAKCRLGVALTTSSGEEKIPTAHRVFLSRVPIGEDLLQKIEPYLKIQSEELLIREQDFMGLINEQDSFSEADLSRLKKLCVMDSYITIDESTLRKYNKRLSHREMAGLLSAFRRIAYGEYQTSLSEKDDLMSFELFRLIET